MHGQEYEVLVVDTAGQDEYSIFPTQVLLISRLFLLEGHLFLLEDHLFQTFAIQYSVDIDGYVMVYSIDNQKSFEVIWHFVLKPKG